MNDFVEETDYSRVPTAELLTRIEQYADILRGAALFDLDRIMSPARELAARAERAEDDNLDNIMAALGMNADAARRLREENARLRAQLDAMQVAACPECGVTLAGKLLAPFGRSEGPDYSFRIAVDCAAPDEEARS